MESYILSSYILSCIRILILISTTAKRVAKHLLGLLLLTLILVLARSIIRSYWDSTKTRIWFIVTSSVEQTLHI